jgi:hypothetical protein
MFFLSLNMKFLLNIRNSLQQQQPASQQAIEIRTQGKVRIERGCDRKEGINNGFLFHFGKFVCQKVNVNTNYIQQGRQRVS